MKVFVVDGSTADRQRRVRRLGAMAGLNVVGEAGGEAQALALVGWTRPDLILMALPLAEGSGRQLLAELRRRGHRGRIAVLAGTERDICLPSCIAAGADACYDETAGLEGLFAELALPSPREGAAAGGTGALLLREGLRGLHSHAALCERLTQSARSGMPEGASLAVYVLRMSAARSLPAVQAELLTHLLIERMRDTDAGPSADVLVRRSPTALSLVMPRLDAAAAAAERAARLRTLMDEPVSATERGSALKIELGVALFDTDPIPLRGMLSLAQASAFATQ